MYKIAATKPFDRQYQKFIKKNKELVQNIIDVIEKLRINPFQSTLKTHKVVSRKYGETYSSSITGDLRIIWCFDNKQILIIILLDIGSHSGSRRVYK